MKVLPMILAILAMASSGASYAGEGVSCKSINESGFTLTFRKLTSVRAQGWCQVGKGEFRVYRQGRPFVRALSDWSTCSKAGLTSLAHQGPLRLQIREIGDPSGAQAWIERADGALIQFQCTSN